MKKISWFIQAIILASAISCFSSDIEMPRFTKTQEEEHAETRRNAVKNTEEELEPILQGYPARLPYSIPLEKLLTLDMPDEEKNHIQQIIDTFEILKTSRKIPRDVVLRYNFALDKNDQPVAPKGPACYEPGPRMITIFPQFFTLCPSIQIFFLLHEIQHAKQHHMYGMWEFIVQIHTNPNNLETDADTQAIDALRCQRCLQIVLALQTHDDPTKTSKGYLSQDAMRAIITAKTDMQLCDAHKHNDENNELLSRLLEDTSDLAKFQEIMMLNKKIRFIKDRTSTIKQA